MKKILVSLLLVACVFCIGCKNNDNFDKNDIEEIDIEEVDVNEDNGVNEDDNIAILDAIFEKGKKLLEEGKINEAIEQFNKALEINKNADWIHGDLGRAKAQNNDLNGAIECYTKAIEMNNNRSIYYEWRANAYRELGKEDLAKQDQKIADDLHSKGMD